MSTETKGPRSALAPRPYRAIGRQGLEIVGDQWGDEAGAPVVLLHGGGQNRHAWKGTAAMLARHGYFVTAVDARGHGDSGWSTEGHYEMDDHAADLLSVIETLGRPPAVVGASMGGMTALWAQGAAEQQLFSALILVDVTPRMELSGVTRIMGFMAAHPDGFDSLQQAADVIATYNPHRPRSGDVSGLRKVLRERDGRWHWRWDPRFITSKAELMSGDPTSVEERMTRMATQLHDAARRVEVPALLVRGAESDLVSPESVQEFLAAVPHAGYVDVTGTGHMVAGDDNDAFTAAVLDFLHDHVPADAGESALLAARRLAAHAARRFGHALVHHDAPVDVLDQIAEQLRAATEDLERSPERDRLAAMLASDRLKAMMVGEAPATPADGSTIDFAPYSLVGGAANPLGVAASYVRHGEQVVADVVLGAAFEGPPGRAHGGIVSAVVDETMTALLSVLGTIAFTASLQIDYLGPTPLHAPLEFRARLAERSGRSLTLECTGRSGDDVFVRSTGTFIEVELRQLMADMNQLIDD